MTRPREGPDARSMSPSEAAAKKIADNTIEILRAERDRLFNTVAQQAAEIERLRAFEMAARDLNNDLTRIAKERDEMATQIKKLKEDLEQSEICIQARLDVIDQQAARIKSLKKEIRRLKHESKVEQEFTNSYIKRLHDAEARIKELEAQCEDLMQNCNSLRERAWKAEVRIKELEDALVEYLAADIAYAAGVLWSRLGPRKEEYRERARQQLQAGGKIGTGAGIASSDHIVEADQTVGGRRCHI